MLRCPRLRTRRQEEPSDAYQPPCRGQLTEKCLWAGKVVSQELPLATLEPGDFRCSVQRGQGWTSSGLFIADCEEGRDAFSAPNHVGQFGRKRTLVALAQLGRSGSFSRGIHEQKRRLVSAKVAHEPLALTRRPRTWSASSALLTRHLGCRFLGFPKGHRG